MTHNLDPSSDVPKISNTSISFLLYKSHLKLVLWSRYAFHWLQGFEIPPAPAPALYIIQYYRNLPQKLYKRAVQIWILCHRFRFQPKRPGSEKSQKARIRKISKGPDPKNLFFN